MSTLQLYLGHSVDLCTVYKGFFIYDHDVDVVKIFCFCILVAELLIRC